MEIINKKCSNCHTVFLYSESVSAESCPNCGTEYLNLDESLGAGSPLFNLCE